MAIFRKNKRQFGHRSHRNLFVALFLLLVFGVSGIVTFLLNANAQLVPVASVEIFSEHSDYDNNEPGAWKVTKSAEWTALGKARITFEVESNAKYDDSKKLDVVMVIDDSGSMDGEKMSQVKSDATNLVDVLLSDSANKIALISFDTTATIRSDFTNNKEELLNQINQIPVEGCTNYYDGLLKAEEILADYVAQEGRNLILLFLTDGYPNEQTPNEIAQYKTLKTAHPYMVINGIQYEMGDTVLQPIIDISDYQYIANISSLNNVLFTATVIPYFYEDFVISDYINDDYWTVAGLEAIETSLGGTDLSYDGSTPKITWDLSGVYRSGGIATLTIDVDLKNEFIDQEDLLLPTNKHTEIETEIGDNPDEDKNSFDTPILKDSYDVVYDANTPEGCTEPGVVPDRNSYSIYTSVGISDNVLSCPDYSFKGWRIVTPGVSSINDNYFIMPGNDVLIMAVWGKVDISKSMDGTMHTRASATLESGSIFNKKIKVLAGQSGAGYNTDDNSIVAITKSDQLSTLVNTNDSKYIVSTTGSQVPVYAWFDNGTLFYYSEADDIYMNDSSTYMFNRLKALTNIDGLAHLNASRVRYMSDMFLGVIALQNVDALSSWDTSNVRSMSYMFDATLALSNIDGLANWNTSSLQNMSYMFSDADSLVRVDALLNWDTSNVTDMTDLFLYSQNLADISGLANWNTSKVTEMSGMFWGTAITNVDALATKTVDGTVRWDVSNVEYMSYMFIYTQLADISGLSNWDTSGAGYMHNMFDSVKITNVDALSDWDTSNVRNMSSMFAGASNLVDLSGLANWNTSKVENMSSMFAAIKSPNVDAIATKTVDGIVRWDTSKVKNMSKMFYHSYNSNLENIDGLSNWDTSSVTDMTEMFYTAKITNVDALATKTVDGIVRWDVSNVTNMQGMFNQNKNLTDISGLSNWDPENVSNMSSMFYATKITNVDALSNWNTRSLAVTSSMFSSVSNLTNIDGLANWNTSSLTDVSRMFYATKITNVDALATKTVDGVVRWDTSNITTATRLFYNAANLEDIDGLSDWITSGMTDMSQMFYGTKVSNLDALATKTVDGVVRWDVSNATNMTEMFYRSSGSVLANIDGISNWNTSNVTNMAGMFYGAVNLESVSALGNWNTSNVTNMSNMFYKAKKITNVDALATKTVDGVVRWDVSNVTTMSNMFYENASLEDIDGISNWNVGNVTNMYFMFYNDKNILDLSPLEGWDVSNVTNMTDMFYNIPVATPSWY